MKRKQILLIIIVIWGVLLNACDKNEEIGFDVLDLKTEERIMDITEKSLLEESSLSEELTKEVQSEKGYNLPIIDEEKEEAKRDCFLKLELVDDILKEYDCTIDSSDWILEEKIVQAAKKIGEDGCLVLYGEPYSCMENYEKFEMFLENLKLGNKGTEIIYEVLPKGGINRQKYIYDGNDLYVIAAHSEKNADKFALTYLTSNRIKRWRYTKKGWFAYELCVPEYPEVTEMIDGSCLIRIRPMTVENRRMSDICVSKLPYQGNNLLCSNWDRNHMEDLDYNGLYEYLYEMKFGKKFQPLENQDRISKEEFENLIMEYLPITEKELEIYAAFDQESQTYPWDRLGCFNNSPTFFGTSVPEVTGVRENEDGTLTLTVDAVCQMILCDDAMITHELTIRFLDDGSFQYLGNKILDNELRKIPDYQYRIPKDEFNLDSNIP